MDSYDLRDVAMKIVDRAKHLERQSAPIGDERLVILLRCAAEITMAFSVVLAEKEARNDAART